MEMLIIQSISWSISLQDSPCPMRYSGYLIWIPVALLSFVCNLFPDESRTRETPDNPGGRNYGFKLTDQRN